MLPLGAQRNALRPGADLSLPSLGRIVTEFLEPLDLSDAVVCFNDWGGAQTMVSHGGTERVGAFVFVSCETDRNYPSGVAGQIAALSGSLPGGFGVMRPALGSPMLRKLPFTYGRMSKWGVPDELMRRWLQPLKRAEIRRDTRRYVRDRPPRQTRDSRRDAEAPQLRAPGPRRLGRGGDDDAPTARVAASPGPSQLDLRRAARLLHPDPNANPVSMRAALDHVAGLDAPRSVAVLGEMGELGPGSAGYHREVGFTLYQQSIGS